MIMMRRASITPSMMYRLLVRPPAHRGPRMVARPPTERLTPWLNPVGTVHKCNRASGLFFFYFSLIALHLPTLRFLCRDFGEERHLGHSHEGEPQQLQEHPDDEGRQLPPVAPWQVWRDGKRQRKEHQSFSIPANRNLTLIAASNV